MLTVTGSLSAAETAAIHAGNSGSYRERFHTAAGFITVVNHVKSWFVQRAGFMQLLYFIAVVHNMKSWFVQTVGAIQLNTVLQSYIT